MTIPYRMAIVQGNARMKWTQISCTQQASVVDGASNHSPSIERAHSLEQQVGRYVSKIDASGELAK